MEGKLNGLDLFTGIGGLTIALQDWVKPIAYCEREPFVIAWLLESMRSGKIPVAPVCTDIRDLKGDMCPDAEIIYGGFPCQDISAAGRGVGLAGERSGLFFEIIRLTKEIKPSFVFLENVPAIRTRGLREVVRAFTEVGYDCRWTCITASSLGAPHRRERWFILAYSDSKSSRDKWKTMEPKNAEVGFESAANTRNDGDEKSLAYAASLKSDEGPWWREESDAESENPFSKNWWSTEPNVGRVVNGLPFRVERIKSLGNAVVPFQAKTAFERLCGMNSLNLNTPKQAEMAVE